MWQRGRVAKERSRWLTLFPRCLRCNTVYLVEGRVVLIEFLPSDTGPIATCVGAAPGCGKPNTRAQVVQRGGEWPFMTVAQPVPSVIRNSAFLLSGSRRREPHYHIQIRAGDISKKKKKHHLPKLSLYIRVLLVCCCFVFFCVFILRLPSNWDFKSESLKANTIQSLIVRKMKRLFNREKINK